MSFAALKRSAAQKRRVLPKKPAVSKRRESVKKKLG